MLSNLFKKEDVKFTWCRLFYLYGEGEDKRRLYAYIRERLEKNQTVELTSGNQIRDFLDVKDAARMIVDVSISDTNGIVNICSGIPITVRQFAEGIADLYGKRHLLKFGMRADNAFDPSCVVGIRTSG